MADVAPAPHKIVQTSELIVIMYELFGGHRQVYLDGRKLPVDPQPLWLGYSVGHWEGQTLGRAVQSPRGTWVGQRKSVQY
jgi:hypothetical protein